MLTRQAGPLWRSSGAQGRQRVALLSDGASTSKVTLDAPLSYMTAASAIHRHALTCVSGSLPRLPLSATSPRRAGVKGARAIEERDLQKELKKLRAQVAEAEKARDAQEAAAAFGNVTEETLDTLFEAVSTPDPPSAEEHRLAQRKRHRAHLRLGRQQEDLTARIEAIVERLEAVHQYVAKQQVQCGESRHIDEGKGDPLDRITAAVKRLTEARQAEAQETNSDAEDVDSEDKVTSELAGEGPSSDLQASSTLTEAGQRVLQYLEQQSAHGGEATSGTSTLPVPLVGLLDFQDLARAFATSSVTSHDHADLRRQFELMSQLGHGESRARALDSALDDLAARGEVASVLEVLDLAQECGIEPTQFSSHCLVKVHTVAGRLDEADRLLRQLEGTKPADMMTYSLVIKALLSQRDDGASQSRVYEGFDRMRQRAHPTPDALLFSQVIQACALGIPQPKSHLWRPTSKMMADGHDAAVGRSNSLLNKRVPDTERAFDYFKEMTEHLGITPTVEVYDAIILACARRRDMYDKALELLQNVIELERRQASASSDGEASPSAFAPSVTTFNAVLAGCARNGDLFRARWILAEMLRVSVALWKSYERRVSLGISRPWERREAISRRPNAETIALLFYTYASYKVPTRLPLRHLPKAQSTSHDSKEEDTTKELQGRAEDHDDVNLSRQLPQTRRAVLAEIDGLMARLLADRQDKVAEGLFSEITPHSKLVNGYIAAVTAHSKGEGRLSRLSEVLFGVDREESLLVRLEVPLNGHICASILEAVVTETDRQHADDLAGRAWQLFEPFEDAWRLQTAARTGSHSIDASVVSRAWAARIGNLAKSHQLRAALDCVQTFAALYPPQQTEDTDIVVDVPQSTADRPVLTYQSLSLLHHRLKLLQYSEATKEGLQRIGRDIATVTWTAHAYEAMLRPKVPGSYRREPKRQPPPPKLKPHMLNLDLSSSKAVQGRHSPL